MKLFSFLDEPVSNFWISEYFLENPVSAIIDSIKYLSFLGNPSSINISQLALSNICLFVTSEVQKDDGNNAREPE